MSRVLTTLAAVLVVSSACNRGGDETPPDPAETPSGVETASPTTPPVAAQDTGADTGSTIADQGQTSRGTASADGPDLESFIASRTAQRSLAPLEIENYLGRGDIREITHFTGTLTETDLEGQTIDSEYNGIRFAGDGHLGVALQAWDFSSSAAANQHYERLRSTYIDSVVSRADIGDSAFSSSYPGVFQFVFMNRRRSMVVAVACDAQVCGGGEDDVEALASRVFLNM